MKKETKKETKKKTKEETEENTATLKEKIYDELKTHTPGEPIKMVETSRKIGCSISYLSSTLRHTMEAGFAGVHANGSYITIDIPNTYREFQEGVNEKYEKYRKTVPSGGANKRTYPSRTRTKKIPEDFVIDEDTVFSVIKKIITDNNEMKEKLDKLITYTKKIVKERDDLLESIQEY